MYDRSVPFFKLKIIIQSLTFTFLFIQMITLIFYVKLRSEERTKLFHIHHTYGEKINTGLSQEKCQVCREVKGNVSEIGVESKTIALTLQGYKRKKLIDISPSTSNIFFIESKCGTRKLSEIENGHQAKFVLSARQSCSVESAATMNPSRNVYILHTCPQNREAQTPEYAQQLLSLDNVWLVHLNVTEFFQGTPVETLHLSGRIEQSLYPVEHSSDIMRLTVLWRFGGTYMDLDVITLRQLDDLKTDFCGLVNDVTIGNAILNFEPQGFGHRLLEKTLDHLNSNFNGNLWAVNGPELITKIINQGCNTTDMQVRNCSVFKVYDKSVLYPMYYTEHKQLFAPQVGEEVVHKVKKTAYMIHLWNKYTKEYQVQINSTQAYSLLARQCCPRVHNSVDNTF